MPKRRAKQPAPPTDQLTVIDSRNEPLNIARGMSVDAVHAAIQQAEIGDVRSLFALYRDLIMSSAHIQAEFSKRKLAVLGQQPTIAAFKTGDPEKAEAAAAATFIGDNLADAMAVFRAYNHLLDSCLWPVSVVEKTFVVEDGKFRLATLTPVPHYLLDFSSGRLRIFDVTQDGTILSTTHDASPDRYIIHRGHLLTTADNYGGPMRAILFWWLLGNMSREWWGRYLDRFGSPFLVGKYDSGDNDSKSVMERAFKLATRLGGLVITKESQVEIVQAAAASTGEAYDRFIQLCNNECSKLIVGQTLSASATSTGLGSGVANLQASVRSDIRAFDATMLGQTLRDQLFTQLLDINGISGNAPSISFGQEISRDSVQVSGAILQSLFASGLQLTDEGVAALSRQLGLQLERRSASAPLNLSTLSISPSQRNDIDAIARAGAAPLARAFSGAFAPIRQIILSSSSSEECSTRIRALYADYPAARLADLIEQALSAYAANGV
jgi:phage gp29-like protein